MTTPGSAAEGSSGGIRRHDLGNIVRSLYKVLISLAMIGAAVTLARRSRDLQAALPLMIVVWYCLPFLLTVAANRYKTPVLGLCWIYLANGLVEAVRVATRRGAVQPDRV